MSIPDGPSRNELPLSARSSPLYRTPSEAGEGVTMRRLAGLLLLCAAGCSTSPLADFLDFAFPPRTIPPNTATYGGVAGPQPAPPPPTVPLPSTELPGIPVPSASRQP